MIHQVAFPTGQIDIAVEELMSSGYNQWMRDQVTGVLYLPPDEQPYLAQKRLAFNHQIMDGVEFVFVQYETVPNFIQKFNMNNPGAVCHFGVLVDSEADRERVLEKFGVQKKLQEFWTMHHTREFSRLSGKEGFYLDEIYSVDKLPAPLKVFRHSEDLELFESHRKVFEALAS